MSTPITTVKSPSAKDFERAITAYGTFTSAGATTALTLTLDNDYPPIERKIQSPILGIQLIADETAVAVGDFQVFIPSGQMERATAPDSAGEFQITGARTVSVFNTPDKDGKFTMTYIPEKATGHQH